MNLSIAKHEHERRKDVSKRLLLRYRNTAPKTWDAVDIIVIDICKRRLPATYKTGPVSYIKLSQFCEAWTRGDHEEQVVLPVPSLTSPSPSSPPTNPSEVNQFGEIVLFPEQWDTFRKLRDAYNNNTIEGALNNGFMGSGKTYIFLALVHEFGIRQRLHEKDFMAKLRTVPYLILTRKTLIDQTRNVAIQMGLGPLLQKGKLWILPYAALSSSLSSRFYKTEYDAFSNTNVLTWNAQAVPFFLACDECQSLCNPETTQTRAFVALLEASKTMKCMTLLLSGTPADTVAKAGTVIASFRRPISIGDKSILVRTPQDWVKEYSFAICEDPTKSNNAAMKRLRDVIDPYVFEIENVRWPARARNRTLIVDFENDDCRTRYDKAYKVYEENMHKAGRSTDAGTFQEWVAINVFRKTVEPLRNYAIAQRIVQNLKSNVATCVGHVYKQSVTDLVFRLEALGIRRDQISIIWGGGKDYDEANTYSEAVLNDYIQRIQAGERLPKSVLNRLKKTLSFREEVLMSGESTEERYARYDKLRELGMTGSQSADQRWREIQRFQTGITKICIFTLASGGVGLSLDQSKPELWKRELIAGLCLSGPEFAQVLGRLVRRGTMPGYVDQYIALMRDTVESAVLQPIIVRKLGNIKELASKGINPSEVILSEDGKTFGHTEVSIDQLNAIADSDDSQIHGDIVNEDEEEEEIAA